jgi:hypothetical protein
LFFHLVENSQFADFILARLHFRHLRVSDVEILIALPLAMAATVPRPMAVHEKIINFL